MNFSNFHLTFISLCIAWTCNIHIANAIVCYKCDSLSLPACAISLDETDLPFEQCDKSSLQCTMSIVDSITYRGCSSNTPTIGATYKKLCPDNLCNKGVYPPGRLKCYQCHGADCVEKREGKPHPCLYHHEEDECFTEIVSRNEVNRGCKSDTNHTVNAEVIFCDVNGCNNEPAITKIKCATCDSKKDRGCKMDLFDINKKDCNITIYDMCEVDSFLNRPQTCFFYHHLDRVVRGCTQNLPPELKGDNQNILECNQHDFCNAHCLKRQNCLVCDSISNPNCRDNVTDIAINVCGSAETSSCFACELIGFAVERGCGRIPYKSTEVRRCYECDEPNGCNAKHLTRCYKCSSNDDPSCATWDRPGNLYIEDCIVPGAACITKTLSSWETIRGCESPTLSCNISDISCIRCNGNFCNKEHHTIDYRLRCYQCTGKEECASNKKDPLPCPYVSVISPEACFEYINDKNELIRGCRSNSSQYYDCMMHKNGTPCRLCYKNGCNNSYSTLSTHFLSLLRQ